MTEAAAISEIVEKTPNLENFDFEDFEAVEDAFPNIEQSMEDGFALFDVGFVKWFRATKEQKEGRTITTGYGFIHSRNGDVYFRLPACKKYEFDAETNGKKLVRQYRRVNPGQPVTFNYTETERGLRTDLCVFWEPEEFQKVSKQMASCAPFPHRLVRITKRIDVSSNRTVSIDEDVIWEGTDLDEFRVTCPRIEKEYKVYRSAPEVENGVKTIVYQRVEYRDMLNGAEHKPWVVCFDPR